VALLHEVDEAAGGADDDLDALLQRLDLRLVGAAAVDAQDADAAQTAGLLQVVGDLDAELAGRDDDERLRLAGGLELGPGVVLRRGEALQERDAEAEGLAGAGLGLADEVGPLQGQGQRELLDREGGDDAVGGQRLDGGGQDAELGEGLGLGGSGGLDVRGGVGLGSGRGDGVLRGQGRGGTPSQEATSPASAWSRGVAASPCR
jgi:hypothetical protein